MSNRKAIIIFTITTYLLTLLLTISKSELANALAQAVPAFVALLLILFSKKIKAEIDNAGFLKIGNIKWYILALFLPFTGIAISYSVATLLGFFSLQSHLAWFVFIYRFLLFTFMWPLIWAIGEEIGWRGFLQPKLTELVGLRQGILLTGIIWAIWHFIFIFLGGYYETGNIVINSLLLATTVILMSFSIGWIRWASKSVWPCVVFHSASNAAWQMWSYQFQIINSNYIYVSGEAGILNIIFWGLLAFLILKNKKCLKGKGSR